MINTRQRYEDIEARSLAPYAMKSGASRGREYPETEQEYRTAFQRDRDRILHTTAFRRLEYKTQVFINYEGDYYRTRLTHTLEVSQVGRSLARALCANEDLAEAICLSHDLGHPPFGHSGEAILNKLMADNGGFDHNKQSFRIVTKLEQRYPGWPGLNLTYEVREGIVKHETKYDVSDSQSQGFDADKRGGIEAQIANMSDELAYNAHDLDDGLRSGLIEPEQLDDLAIWQMLKDSIGWDGRHFTEQIRHQIIRRMIGIEINDVIEATGAKLEGLDLTSPEDLQRLPYNVVVHSDHLEAMNHELQTFLYDCLYRHYRVVRMAVKAERVVTQLFETYTAESNQLPPTVQQAIEHRGLPRGICDYIAGMTDRFALEEWRRLFDPFQRP
ncbi:MAG TPA: deoxyguanosinetriphosphate triphosphohydrolase [Aggregatilinea sp.]|jgi:dGTPase|uniref:deoxyguanosinetriphosphate triphosphohydrolase n=1 Tax=Aggregatilinea sp. TaxID=2806333 RepID=UPI002C6E3723|nr:deoxyguanosinetriphosphate triphosphohydrolase [Aggregatilinea sp.]HML20115.1 deoxyguanosinetriphosphate triphosphohydrolase [Aggregatilinea sp.]